MNDLEERAYEILKTPHTTTQLTNKLWNNPTTNQHHRQTGEIITNLLRAKRITRIFTEQNDVQYQTVKTP